MQQQMAHRCGARLAHLGTDDAGMTTAEYAVGMIAACGFAGALVKLLASDRVTGMLAGVVEHALSIAI